MGEIVRVGDGGLIQTMADAERAATAMAQSGFFQDAKQAAQAIVKILAGQEMGFGPFAAMTGIYIIQGRPAIGANLMAAAVKRSGRYNYRVIEMTDDRCAITFYEDGQPIGESVFTVEDAKKAQTKNLDKFARNMLFARAMSNGVRWYCPDVFNAPTYTPEELGANVDGNGSVIDAPVREVKPEAPTVTQAPEALAEKPAPKVVAPKPEPPSPGDVDQYPVDSWVNFRDYVVRNIDHYTSGNHVINALRQCYGADYEPWRKWSEVEAVKCWECLTSRLDKDDPQGADGDPERPF